mgnify:CR=1 FL=1|tara:strand:+ start:347 stop:883 length:537 start_codon:yes stop_codon:yes gene_type:complete
MQISLESKRAFVTAGRDGMGRTMAITMHERGAEVFTCDIDPSGLATLPDGITTQECDVSNSSALNAIFDEILPGGLDIMINNAGVGGPTKLVEDVTDEEWDHCISICIDAQLYCARRMAPVFSPRGPSLQGPAERRHYQHDLGCRHHGLPRPVFVCRRQVGGRRLHRDARNGARTRQR